MITIGLASSDADIGCILLLRPAGDRSYVAARQILGPRARVGVTDRYPRREMADSVYRVTEVVGVSADSWEQATKNAVEKVSETVRDLRIAEVVRQDVTIDGGTVSEFRIRLGISFKYDKEEGPGFKGPPGHQPRALERGPLVCIGWPHGTPGRNRAPRDRRLRKRRRA